MKNTSSFFKKPLIISLLIVGLSSCKKDDSVEINDFSGYYKIVSINSSIPIDCNNDGIKSNNYLQEISSGYRLNNEIVNGFFSIDNPRFFVEVRPLYYQNNYAKLIAFNFPHQYIMFLNDNSQLPFLSWYSSELINYSYEFINDGEVKIIANDPEFSKKIANKLTIKRKDKTEFELNMNMQIFDFVSKNWIESSIRVRYRKNK
ncbi:MAG: hypothetical protein RLZZ306_2476 [Bacteroidota bacterium]|jgi:hypothetical protein